MLEGQHLKKSKALRASVGTDDAASATHMSLVTMNPNDPKKYALCRGPCIDGLK